MNEIHVSVELQTFNTTNSKEHAHESSEPQTSTKSFNLYAL